MNHVVSICAIQMHSYSIDIGLLFSLKQSFIYAYEMFVMLSYIVLLFFVLLIQSTLLYTTYTNEAKIFIFCLMSYLNSFMIYLDVISLNAGGFIHIYFVLSIPNL